MDWFRWWHGSVDDPKFRMIAEDMKLPVATVLGMWIYILEVASKNDDHRGYLTDFDDEAEDVMRFALGLDSSVTPCHAFKKRKLLVTENGMLKVAKWEKRQPKRDREDPNAAERKRQQREREKQEKQAEANKNNDLVSKKTDVTEEVTTGHAKSRQVTPREDKSREDKSREEVNPKPPRKGAALEEQPDPLPDWLEPDHWKRFTDWRKKRDGKAFSAEAHNLNLRELTKLQAEGFDPVAIIDQSIARNWSGLFRIKGLKPGELPPDPALSHLGPHGQATAIAAQRFLNRDRSNEK